MAIAEIPLTAIGSGGAAALFDAHAERAKALIDTALHSYPLLPTAAAVTSAGIITAYRDRSDAAGRAARMPGAMGDLKHFPRHPPRATRHVPASPSGTPPRPAPRRTPGGSRCRPRRPRIASA